MGVPYYIAKKYFYSKKKKNFINIISIISMLVIGVSTMAIIIILSFFNGIEELLIDFYRNLDPEIAIYPQKGKTFEMDSLTKKQIQSIEGIDGVIEIIEDNVLIKYKDNQKVVKLKGVSNEFITKGRFKREFLVQGDPILIENNRHFALLGRGVQYDLSLNIEDEYNHLQMYFPKNIDPSVVMPSQMFEIMNIKPSGIFTIEKSIDENMVFVPLEFAVALFRYENKRTSVECILKKGSSRHNVKEELQKILSEDFVIKLGEEHHEELVRMLKIEKLFVYLIFIFIIAIASLNIYFSLSMLAIDKKNDMYLLFTFGATKNFIKKIFIFEGALISLVGSFVGLCLGLAFCFLQHQFKILSIGMQNGIIEHYPLKIEIEDLLFSVAIIVVVTILVSIPPGKKVVNSF